MRRISVLSFDLGSYLGYAKSIITLDGTFKMDVVQHGTYDLDKLTNDYIRNENPQYGRQRVKMNIFEKKVTALARSMRFNAFVVEDAFLNPRIPNAFRTLTIYLDNLDRVITNDFASTVDTITARNIKKHIAGYGGADKMQVQQAILDNDSITLTDNRMMTEHSADAIAGAYAYVRRNFFEII